MTKPFARGAASWTRHDLLKAIPAFLELFKQRPIANNQGGMQAPHMFATWFIARKLSPRFIIESGVFRGQSTWLLERACPEAKLISIDLDLSKRMYISENADYHDVDFSKLDWSHLDPTNTLVFFDDHQNAPSRVQQCKSFGFRHLIFEDNYPSGHGDCYSLKQAFERGGQSVDEHIETYHEFPPVFQAEFTRFGEPWTADRYPTEEPLLRERDQNGYPEFFHSAQAYTWLAYVKLWQNFETSLTAC